MNESSMPVRRKDREGRTVTDFIPAIQCAPCNGRGFIGDGIVDMCPTCKGRGVLVKKTAPLPQIDW